MNAKRKPPRDRTGRSASRPSPTPTRTERTKAAPVSREPRFPGQPATEGFRYSCTACGLCCRWGGQVYLYPADVLRLAEQLALPLQKFVDRYCNHVLIGFPDKEGASILPFLVLKNVPDKDPKGCGQACPFQGADNRCTVHAFKPGQCADSPIIPEFMEDPESFASFARECPGMGQGEFHSPTKVRRLLKELAGRDALYEAQLERCDYDLGRLLGVKLPPPKIEEGLAVEVD